MSTAGLKEALLKEIAEAERCYTNPPANEACTCEWVILPLLRAAGYSKWDIVPQASNGSGFPDYTILSGTQYTWYLEAKDWKKSLDNGPEAIQALNYANAHGHRWVVLSNGKEWLLFDNYIQGVGADKRLVARSSIQDPAFLDFMLALSKDSIQKGALAAYAASWQLRAVLRQQLLSHDSHIIKGITKALKGEPGLSAIQNSDVAGYFMEMLDGLAPPAVAPAVPAREPRPSIQANEGISLADLLEMGKALWNRTPAELILPDGRSIIPTSWRAVASEIVTWIAHNRGLPQLPFQGLPSGDRWFLSTTAVHSNGKEMDHYTLQLAGQTVYMDVNRSSTNFTCCLCALCEATGASAAAFVVRLK